MARLFYLLPLSLFLLLGIYFAAGLTRDPSLIPSVLLNKPAPSFDLLPIEGYEDGFSSQDLSDEVTLVNIFASWCISCQIEHPMLMELAAQGDIPVMGINWKDKPGDGSAWLKRHGDPYTLIGDDANGRTAIDFGVTGAPETFVIDKNGRIRYKQVGPITPQIWRDILKPMVEDLRDADVENFSGSDDVLDGNHTDNGPGTSS